jgi:hypothetical protein
MARNRGGGRNAAQAAVVKDSVKNLVNDVAAALGAETGDAEMLRVTLESVIGKWDMTRQGQVY